MNINQKLSGESKRKIDILLSFGANKEIDSSLSKLINFQIGKYKSNIRQTKCELGRFEKKYNLTSEEFYKKFESGEMGDTADYFEWAGLYENVLLYDERIRTFESVLKGD